MSDCDISAEDFSTPTALLDSPEDLKALWGAIKFEARQLLELRGSLHLLSEVEQHAKEVRSLNPADFDSTWAPTLRKLYASGKAIQRRFDDQSPQFACVREGKNRFVRPPTPYMKPVESVEESSSSLMLNHATDASDATIPILVSSASELIHSSKKALQSSARLMEQLSGLYQKSGDKTSGEKTCAALQRLDDLNRLLIDLEQSWRLV